MDDPEDPFAKIVLDAIRKHMTDMKTVEREVWQKVGATDPAVREQISENIRRLTSFQMPGFREKPD